MYVLSKFEFIANDHKPTKQLSVMNNEEEVRLLTKLAKESFHLFASNKNYSQATIRRKLKSLGYTISASTISNSLNGKQVGVKSLRILIMGLNDLLSEELGYWINTDSASIIKSTQSLFKPTIIEEETHGEADKKYYSTVNVHCKGRLPLHEKLAFWQAAEYEIIELGVRLNTFVNCFHSRSDNEFKDKIIELLDRAVNIKLALLDPSHYKTEIYFRDRSESIPDEANSQKVIKKSIEYLKEIIPQINKVSGKGEIQLYEYQHIPYNNFVIIDGRKPNGKMLISPYLYGQRRAQSPILEIHRRRNFNLYQLYWDSYKYIIKSAKRIV